MSKEKLVLKVTGLDGSVQTRTLEDGECVLVGSGERASLRLEGVEVSQLHSMVKLENGEVTVIDLGSATGTRVAGKPIQGATKLAVGEAIEIGRLRVHLVHEVHPVHSLAVQGSPPKARRSLAERLLEEPLPPGEAPASDAKQLEIAMLWGDTLLDVRHFREGEQVRIGSERGNQFHVEGAGETIALARCEGEACALSIPAGAQVRWRGGASKSSSALELDDRVEVTLGAVSFVARWVRPPARAKAARRAWDFHFAKVLTTSLMGATAVLAAIFMTDTTATSLSEDIFKGTQRWQVAFKSPSRIKRRPIPLPAKEPAQKPTERFQQTQTDKTGPAKPLKDRAMNEEKVRHAGLLGLLDGADGAKSNIFNSGGMGSKINEYLGELKSNDSSDSDAHGMGAMGSRGSTPGGGINNLGINGLGTRFGGRGGPGGKNPFDVSFDDGKKHGTAVLPPKTIVVGGCERTVIARVIARHSNEVRFCYESRLSNDPNLAGKLAVSFTIDPTGAVSEADVAQSTLGDSTVEQCVLSRVRRWKFPEPKGGVCVINYPYVFQPAGSGSGDGSAE